MRKSRILQKLRHRVPTLVTTLHICDPSIYELASLMGFDGLWLDMEHHAHSMETAHNLMRAARVGTSDVIARPAKGEFMRMGRLLEAGAQGIMYPRCESAAEAAEVVKWSKFAPLGRRGCDSGGPDTPYLSMPLAKYIHEANQETFLIVQIEDQSALDVVEEIAAVDGVDIIMLGPGDFSALNGFPGEMDHPRLTEAKSRISAAALSAGKHWGLPVATLEQARDALNRGACFLASGADISFVKVALERLQQQFGELGFTFENRLSQNSKM